MMPTRLLKTISLSLMLALSVSAAGFLDLPADAAKKGKKGGASEADMEKGLETINKTITELLVRADARGLFSPEESGKLTDVNYQLIDFMKDFPTNALLVKPVYQTGLLNFKREQYQEAYDLYTFLVTNFPENPYAMRAKADISKMKKQLGEAYFGQAEQPKATP